MSNRIKIKYDRLLKQFWGEILHETNASPTGQDSETLRTSGALWCRSIIMGDSMEQCL